MAFSIEFNEFLYFIAQDQLNEKGIGFIGIYLLESAELSQILLWTEDKRFMKAAAGLDLKYEKKNKMPFSRNGRVITFEIFRHS